mmetsp:Transcript_155209/g.497762  ORF Transcript_155209/g.497762 Transcript_155209/m.497762 type:complete len:125 (+) Transcript_155209:374-748(+)
MPTNLEYMQAIRSAQFAHPCDYIMMDKHPAELFSHLKDAATGKKAAETMQVALGGPQKPAAAPVPQAAALPLSGWPTLSEDKKASPAPAVADGRVPCSGCAKRGAERPTMVVPGRSCWLCGCKN